MRDISAALAAKSVVNDRGSPFNAKWDLGDAGGIIRRMPDASSLVSHAEGFDPTIKRSAVCGWRR